MTYIAEMRAMLEQQLSELKARQSHLGVDLAQPLDPDSGERAVETEDDASLEAQSRLVTQEINSVERALQRIDQGTYGQCIKCGEAIATKRLEARPEAALCLGCACAP